MSARLTDRVLRNYAWQEPVAQRSPIEIMSLIYPGMFGSGLSGAAGGVAEGGEADIVDLGIGTYLRTDPEIVRAVSADMQGPEFALSPAPGREPARGAKVSG